jgi:hypothetical protein
MLPFQYTMAYRLIDIAKDKRILAHVPTLPPSLGTLHELTKHDDATWAEALKRGIIRCDMETYEARQLLQDLHYKLVDETPRPVGQPREVNLRNVETLHRDPDTPITPVMMSPREQRILEMKEPVRGAKELEKAAQQLADWLKRWEPLIVKGRRLFPTLGSPVPAGACDLVRTAQRVICEHRHQLLGTARFSVVGKSNPDKPDEPPPGSNEPPDSAA